MHMQTRMQTHIPNMQTQMRTRMHTRVHTHNHTVQIATHLQPGRIGRVTTYYESLLTVVSHLQPGRIGRVEREHGYPARVYVSAVTDLTRLRLLCLRVAQD